MLISVCPLVLVITTINPCLLCSSCSCHGNHTLPMLLLLLSSHGICAYWLPRRSESGGSKSSVTVSEWCHCRWVASQLCDHQPPLLPPDMTFSICPYSKLSGVEVPGSLLAPWDTKALYLQWWGQEAALAFAVTVFKHCLLFPLLWIFFRYHPGHARHCQYKAQTKRPDKENCQEKGADVKRHNRQSLAGKNVWKNSGRFWPRSDGV